MSLDGLLAKIPYVALHGVVAKVLDDGAVEISMARRPELSNYVGILHAGALFTAAETAAGAAAFAVVPGGGAMVLLRRVDVRYTRRAETDVKATAKVDATLAAAARSAFAETQRGDITVEVVATDASGATVLEAEFEYAMRPMSA